MLFWLEILKGRGHSEVLSIKRKILRKSGDRVGLDSFGSQEGLVVGSDKHSKESSGIFFIGWVIMGF
jgi:hypothetical protein